MHNIALKYSKTDDKHSAANELGGLANDYTTLCAQQ